jgi:hypothetical protein
MMPVHKIAGETASATARPAANTLFAIRRSIVLPHFSSLPVKALPWVAQMKRINCLPAHN